MMHDIILQHIDTWLSQFGYALVGVAIMLESMGLPLPAESLLIGTAIYCAATHKLNIVLVSLTAICGAIIGDNMGYLIGYLVGYPLLIKHGWKIRLTPQRLMLGRYIFQKHGGKVVFFGRFVAVLRVFAALLAGANHMPWKSFLFYNMLGGVVWAGGYSLCAYYLGERIFALSTPVGLAVGAGVVIVLISSFIFLKKNEYRLTQEAIQEMEKTK